MATKPRKTMYQSNVTSVSREATSSISYWKLVSRRRPGAHSRDVATNNGLGGGAGSN